MARARRGPNAGTQPADRAGQRERPGRLRDEAQAGEHRAEPSTLLQVQRRQQDLSGVEGAHRAQGPALPGDERGQQQERDCGQQRRLGGLQRIDRSAGAHARLRSFSPG